MNSERPPGNLVNACLRPRWRGAPRLFSFLIVATLAAGASAAIADPAAAAAGVRHLIAHRGAMAEAPENTLAAIRRAIEAGATAVEMDVRTSRDGRLFLLHDATLDRTTDSKGPANALTLSELQTLDAGTWFAPEFQKERIPALREALALCRGRLDVLLDLKETGEAHAQAVVAEIRRFGEPARTILGIRNVEEAALFRKLLPNVRQLGFIPRVDDIESFAAAGVEVIRLWPKWLDDGDAVGRVARSGAQLHLNGKTGDLAETLFLLEHKPVSLLVDDPARLRKSLEQIGAGAKP